MPRTRSIDLLRGFIMIFMALDHASGMIARVHFSEIWGVEFTAYPDTFWWFTRFVSHLCAPGFFLLMGVSMFLFAQSRMKASWSANKINLYFLKRGGLILLFMFCLEFPAWGLSFFFNELHAAQPPFPGSSTGIFIPTTVLYGLGMSMILGGMLWRIKGWQLLSITAGCFALSGWYIAQADPTSAFNPLEHLFLVPGASNYVMTIYPIIPWIGVCTFGMFWAKYFMQKGKSAFTLAAVTGVVFLIAFAVLRSTGHGNHNYTSYDSFITFFTLIKYPASVDFFLITIGINLLLLALFSKIEDQAWLRPVQVFGQTAMFFYIVHLYLYALIGAFFPLGCHIAVMYACWIGGLILLYFICKRFLEFKKTTPTTSFWRLV